MNDIPHYAIFLCFEDEVKKFKFFAFYFRILLCVLLTNFFVAKMGWHFLAGNISISSIIDFIISGKAMIIIISFGISILVMFYMYNIVYFLIASLFYGLNRLIYSKRVWPINKMLYYDMIEKKDAKYVKSQDYDNGLDIIELVTDSQPIYAAKVINSICSGTLLVYISYPEIQVLPQFFENILWFISVFYAFNLIYLYYLRMIAKDISRYCNETFDEESRKRTRVL